jgi:hypothetical protein
MMWRRIANPIIGCFACVLRSLCLLFRRRIPRRVGPMPGDYPIPELGRKIEGPSEPPIVDTRLNGRHHLLPRVEPVLKLVHPDLLPLQRKTIEVLFGPLRIHYVPALLLGALREFDVRYAFAAFVERFGMQYGVLLTPDHPEHVAQRDRLEDIVGFLLEVEECGKGSSLLSKPIHDGLVRSIEEAEVLLERFRQAVSVERSIEAGEIAFPKYGEFRERVRQRLQQWHEVPPEELGDIFVINRGYVILQEGFNTVIARIHERIALVARQH